MCGFLQGQDLFLTFTGSGTSVDSVRVENLTSGRKIIVGGNQVLHLNQIITEAEKNNIDAGQDDITFFPNPMNESSIMKFSIPVSGYTVISMIDLDGKETLTLTGYLSKGQHSYRLSGIRSGIHFLMVKSGQHSITGTLISTSMQGNAYAEYINSISLTEPGKDMPALKKAEAVNKGAFSEVTMQYNDGDSLKFTASSGNYRTVIIDVPDISKTLTFDFFECTDGDNNNYKSVKIGNNVWMAENLKTTKFNDGTPIRYERDDSMWASLDNKGIPAFSWYNNNEEYKNIYGGLYNNAVVSGLSGKNICPAGWHVAAGEWKELFSFLDSAAAPDGEVSKTAGNLIKESGNMHWDCPGNSAANETGFTALPGGLRRPDFAHLGQRAYFWDGESGKYILYCTSGVVGHLSEKFDYGLSVRCVKNSGFYISFGGTGAAASVADVKVENLSTGAMLTLKGNQTLYLGQDKGPAETVFMQYSMGQNLKFTGVAGNYSTVMVDKPTENKKISFNFIPCTDADNNNYAVVKIGEYTWMAENLKTTKFKDGTSIPYLVDFGWEGYRWYNNDPGYKATYGAIYVMDTFKSGKLCPAGWHAPNNSEWGYLTDFLGGRSEAGGRLKETGTVHWSEPNTGATNESGFTALPGGYLNHVVFDGLGTSAHFWSVSKCGGTSDCGWGIGFNGNTISWSDFNPSVGYSVRCVYGEEPMIPEVGTTQNTTITSAYLPLREENITATTAYTIIAIIKDHGLPVTQSGVCWSTSSMPTINDPHTSDGSGLMTNLEPGTKYYVRGYAINSAGIGYGMSVSFTTKTTVE